MTLVAAASPTKPTDHGFFSHSLDLVQPWLSTMVQPWFSHDLAIIYNGSAMVLSNGSQPWFTHGLTIITMVQPWFSHGLVMVLSHGSAMLEPWLSHMKYVVLSFTTYNYSKNSLTD